MKCATCNETNGCEHFAATKDYSRSQEEIIAASERADGATNKVSSLSPFVPGQSPKGDEPVAYVPAQRDYSRAPAKGESRGPSIVIGARGDRGEPGIGIQGIPGPAGRDGVSPSVDEVIDAAAQMMEQRIADFESGVQAFIRRELQLAGAVDSNGKAILVAGPVGASGPAGQSIKGDSVKGDTGAPGKDAARAKDGRDGVDGRSGRDAVVRVGNVSAGDRAAASIRIMDGVSYLDFVLPRGYRGSDGADSAVPGPRGPAGPIEACLANCSKLINEKLELFRAEISKK
jgi:hypothetical protein